MDEIEKRHIILSAINNSIKECMKMGKVAIEKNLIKCCVEDFSISEDYVKELILELEHDGMLIRDSGLIWGKDKYTNWYQIDKLTGEYERHIADAKKNGQI